METGGQQYFDNMCRTCMNAEIVSPSYDNKLQQQWPSVFGTIEEYGDLPIAELMSKTVPQIEVHPSDELPKKICGECMQHLLGLHRFQQMCVESQQKLRALIANRNADLVLQIRGVPSVVEKNTNEFLKQVILPEARDQIIECVHILSDSSQSCDNDLIPRDTAAKESTSDTELSKQRTILVSKKHLVDRELPEAPQSNIADSFQKIIDKAIEQYISSRGDADVFIKSGPSIDEESNFIYDNSEIVANEPCDDDAPNVEDSDVEFFKNESCDDNDDEPNAEYSAGETMHSSVTRDDVVIVETEDPQKSLRASKHNCQLCNKSFNEKRCLDQHLKRHKKWGRQKGMAAQSNEKKTQFNCDICNLYFYKLETLQFHRLEHKVDKKLPRNICDLCEESFSSTVALKRHTTLKHPSKILNHYLCHICNETFKYPSLLTYHNLRVHSKEQPTSSQKCGQSFNTLDSTTQNLGVDRAPESPQKLPCSSDMSKHKKTHEKVKPQAGHSKEKAYKCDYCEKRFVRLTSQRRHMRQHTDDQRYTCKYCNSSFGYSYGLVTHLRTHLGENVHKCELCPSSFRFASELRTHFIEHRHDDAETRERNMKALEEEEHKLKSLYIMPTYIDDSK